MSAAERPLRIGIACFSTYGGSGVIASEIGLTLAARGHTVHVFSDERPGRLGDTNGTVRFHRVEIPSYPQLKGSPYALGLTSKIVEVAWRDGLDLLHAHYAIPHAISAYVARQVLGSSAPAIVTTLHGTDITLVGNDPSFLPLTRFSIVESDAVTTPSAWLAEATYRNLDIPRERTIDVIPNFVDTQRFAPAAGAPSAVGARPAVLVHVSNFRSLKRVDDVIGIFAEARRRAPERAMTLRLVGDGPERAANPRSGTGGGPRRGGPVPGRAHRSAERAARRGSLPAAERERELRSGGAGGDVVRRAGDRLTRGRRARGGDRRRDGPAGASG